MKGVACLVTCQVDQLLTTLCCAEAACCMGMRPLTPPGMLCGFHAIQDRLRCSHALVTQGAGGPLQVQFVMHISETKQLT